MGDKLIRFSGTAFTDADIDNGDEVHVQVVNDMGGVIADGIGKVAAVTDRPRRDDPTVIERIFSVKVS